MVVRNTSEVLERANVGQWRKQQEEQRGQHVDETPLCQSDFDQTFCMFWIFKLEFWIGSDVNLIELVQQEVRAWNIRRGTNVDAKPGKEIHAYA